MSPTTTPITALPGLRPGLLDLSSILHLLDRVLRKKPGRVPQLHEKTTWLGIRHAFTHPPEREVIGCTTALDYACAVALFFEGSALCKRPTCTLAHVAATVSLVDQDAVLTLLATDPAAARLIAALLDARQQGAHQEVAAVMPGARALVAPQFDLVPSATRQHIEAFFAGAR